MNIYETNRLHAANASVENGKEVLERKFVRMRIIHVNLLYRCLFGWHFTSHCSTVVEANERIK